MVDLDWLSKIRGLAVDDALYLILETVDDAFLEGRFADVDTALDRVDLGELDTFLVIGFLSATRAARDKLTRRAAFVERARSRLLDLGCADRIERLMSGLD